MPEQVPICRNRDSVLGEGVCTILCQHRSACQAQKVPFLIYSVVVDYSYERRKHNRQGLIYPDEYIDELVHERAVVEAES